jgi:hypothetical protein
MVSDFQIGQNNGFRIETDIQKRIDGKGFSEIDFSMRNVLVSIDASIRENDEFTALKKEGQGLAKKTDLFVFRNGRNFSNLSIKSGTGNSVHQENIFQFVEFLSTLNANQHQIDSLLFFHWGDGTLDGTGDIRQRIGTASKIISRYPQKIDEIRHLFKKNKTAIVKRALLGLEDGSEPTYLLHQKSKSEAIIRITSMKDVVEFHCSQTNDHRSLKIGNLNFQNCNRCAKGQEATSNKTRDNIQFKWANISKDLGLVNDD